MFLDRDRNNKKLLNIDVKNQQLLIYNYKNNKKKEYNSIIPLKIYQTWHTKILPLNMKICTDSIKNMHPKFEYFLFDDHDCRDFIIKHFDNNVIEAFDSLIPGAYKADLWRYCVLYITGGIYLDIKYECINGFNFIELTEKEHWVLDIGGANIYNALIAVMPKNITCLNCINQIVINVSNRYYGSSFLDVTGPGLVAKFLKENDKKNIELEHIFNNTKIVKGKFILYNNISILKMYNDYYTEYDKFNKNSHYSVLWNQRKIYNSKSTSTFEKG